MLLAQGQVDDAVAQLKTAIRLDPRLLLAHVNLANALIRQRDLAGAEAEAREAIRGSMATSAEAHRTLGRVLSFDGKSCRMRLPNWRRLSNLIRSVPISRRVWIAARARHSETEGAPNSLPRPFGCTAVSDRPSCTWAWFAGSSSRFDEAQKLLESAAQLLPGLPRKTA